MARSAALGDDGGEAGRSIELADRREGAITMLAFEWTLTNILWTAFLVWAVWMCVVILMFIMRRGSESRR
jgi:hypothetical protein